MTGLDSVFFGGTGDLCLRKLMPALYFLYREDKLPGSSRIWGISRGHMSRDAYRQMVRDKLALYLGDDYAPAVGEAFSEMLDYRDLDIPSDVAWATLAADLAPVGAREIIYYLAVPPTLFGTVCQQLKRHDLNPANSRLIVEKPLGEDEPSAEAVNALLSTSFREDQIYRIDHYLGKEAIQNLLALRFSNRLIGAIWKRDHIESVQITVAETVGVEGRAAFLDRAGILRDMIQNHLMQILCFLAMEAPEDLSADRIRDQKVRVVKALRPITPENVVDHVVRAQYGPGDDMPGYLAETQDSAITGTGETFVALKVLIDNARWRDVPFYLRTGKRLAGRFADIVIRFKAADGGAFSDAAPNRIIIGLQPDMTIRCDIMMKQILTDGQKLSGHSLAADLRGGQDLRIPDAYEKLLGDVMQGNQAYFVRHDEIIAAWKWIDGIRRAWDAAGLEMETYPAGSMGPKAADALLARAGHEWYEDKEGDQDET